MFGRGGYYGRYRGKQKGFKMFVRRADRALGNHICSVTGALPYFMLPCDGSDAFKLLSELRNMQMALDLPQHTVVPLQPAAEEEAAHILKCFCRLTAQPISR